MRRLALLLLCAAPASAFAQATGPGGAIIFARMGEVYQQPADLSQPAVAIAELPDDATEVRWIEAIRDGRLVVVNLVDYPVWIYAPDPTQPALLRGGPCTERARPNPWGGCLVCPAREGPMLVAAGRTDQAPLPVALDEIAFRGDSGFDLAGRGPEGVIGFDRRHPEQRLLLAKQAPRSHLLLAPDGLKAAGVFGEGDAVRIRSFLLDGEGVSRQLGGPGFPTAWSWDSTWILFEEGDIQIDSGTEGGGEESFRASPDDPFLVAAPRRRPPSKPARKKKKPVHAAPQAPSGPLVRACVARATGGEVKCWEGYTGLAFSPDSLLVLLKKEKSLYVGKIAGVRPDPPVKIIDFVEGAATWVPNLIAAPLPPAEPGVDSTP